MCVHNILHIVEDNIFTDVAYESFESVSPLSNTFFLPNMNKKLESIKKTPVKFISPLSFKNPIFMKSLENYDFIVLHSLNRFNQELIAHTKVKLKFVWIGMGYDYYDLIYDNQEFLYQEKTKLIARKVAEPKNTISNILYKCARDVLYKNIEKIKLIEKISYFSPVLENEYNMVGSKFDQNFPRYISWNYGGSVAKTVEGKNKPCSLCGNNIFVGNSGSLTCNHIEVFDVLKNLNLDGKKIVCPLSYGNFKYADIVKANGKVYFGDKFVSLDNFIPYENYLETICSCSNVIMNHHRQQGLGNIVAMLFLGAKIYMNEINPIYSFFKENGGVVFTIKELSESPDLLEFSLSESDIEKNKQILRSIFSEKAIYGKTKLLIETAMS